MPTLWYGFSDAEPTRDGPVPRQLAKIATIDPALAFTTRLSVVMFLDINFAASLVYHRFYSWNPCQLAARFGICFELCWLLFLSTSADDSSCSMFFAQWSAGTS